MLEYKTYFLGKKASHYEDRVAQSAAKLAERLQTQMSLAIIDSLDPISIFSFLTAFQLACDSNGVMRGHPPGSYTSSLNSLLRHRSMHTLH